MAKLSITDQNFEEEVLKSDLPIVVDFYADWCGPCKMIAPIMDEIAEEFDGKWKVGKCDVDANQMIAATFGIQSIPTIIFFKDGKMVDRVIGFQGKESITSRMT